MPELPEVEVVRLYLDQHLLGQSISKLDIITPKSFIGDSNLVLGQKIVKTSRLGKQLSLHLSNGLILLFHLKMTGQIILGDLVFGHPTPKEDRSSLPNKSTRLFFTFKDSQRLYFNDQRKFGWLRLMTTSQLLDFQKDLGLDLLDPKFTSAYLFEQLKKSRRPVKLLLLDQHFFAGIGNIYANDALFLAKIHPLKPANQLSLKEASLLTTSLKKVIKDSIKAGGSTAKDNLFLRPDASFGQNQFNFQVYQREKEPCLLCQTPIKKIKIANRGTFYCPQCQKL